MMDGFGFGHGVGILFWILILVVVVFLVRALSGDSSSGRRGREKSAMDILEERYAKGEIDHEEFDRRKRELRNS